MRSDSIDFKQTGATKLFLDYLSDEDSIRPFFSAGPFDDLHSWQKRATMLSDFPKRDAIADALVKFNADFEPTEKTLQNIEKLRSKTAFTVVTGQQLTIFGGPLYTFLKTITAIKSATYLSEKLNIDVIPVFWLADEDHDFEEMSTVSIPVYDELKTFTLNPFSEEAFAAGKMSLPDSIEQLLNDFTNQLPDTEFTPEIKDMLKRCWKRGASWRTAFGKMMTHYFGRYGLVLAGSDDEQMKRIGVSVLTGAVEHHQEVHSSLIKTSDELTHTYHPQAAVSESNLFYHHPQKGRLKIQVEDNLWMIDDEGFTIAELVNKIQENPVLFSPNVFLRPVLQEYLLPNLAYVGGPAEVAYHAQMSDMFTTLGTSMPILLPRLSATIAEPAIERLFKELSFSMPEYKNRIEDLEKAFIEQSAHEDTTPFFNQWKQEMAQLFDDKTPYLTERDASLKGASHSVKARFEKEIDKLQQKLNRSIKNQEATQLKRIGKVQQGFYPSGNPQERVLSWLYFMAKYGPDQMLGLFDSMDYSLQMLKVHHLIYMK